MNDYVLRLQIVDYRRGTVAKHNFRSETTRNNISHIPVDQT